MARSRSERRAFLTELQRVMSLEEDADGFEEEFAEVKAELKSQTRLIVTILLTLLTSTIAVIGTVVVSTQ